MAMFDEDVAWNRCSRMWQKVARRLEVAAVVAAENGFVQSAITLASASEAAYWQATGLSDIASVKDFHDPGATS